MHYKLNAIDCKTVTFMIDCLTCSTRCSDARSHMSVRCNRPSPHLTVFLISQKEMWNYTLASDANTFNLSSLLSIFSALLLRCFRCCFCIVVLYFASSGWTWNWSRRPKRTRSIFFSLSIFSRPHMHKHYFVRNFISVATATAMASSIAHILVAHVRLR